MFVPARQKRREYSRIREDFNTGGAGIYIFKPPLVLVVKAIPLIMVSGDLLACNEARELVPTVATATVKTGICRNRAECIPHIDALKLIENAACDGVQRMNDIKPYKIPLPTEVELILYRSDYCDEICRYSDYIIRNGRTIKKNVTKIEKYRDILF